MQSSRPLPYPCDSSSNVTKKAERSMASNEALLGPWLKNRERTSAHGALWGGAGRQGGAAPHSGAWGELCPIEMCGVKGGAVPHSDVWG